MTIFYVILAVLIFGAIVLMHELGHYCFARLFKVSITEFSIGMGPKLLQRKAEKTGILWSLRALPFGGYVSMVGEDGETDDPNALQKKAPWQRLIIMAAGGLINILTGIILMSVLVIATRDQLGSTTIYEFIPPENAEVAISDSTGLEAGDKVVKVGNIPVHTANELVYEIMRQGIEPIDLTVIRNGQKLRIENVEFPTFTDQGVTFGDYDFRVYGERSTFANVAKHAFFRSASTVKMVWDGLVDLVTGRYGMEAVSGPVGVTEVIVETAKSKQVANLVYLAAVIAVNLGVMNLLPIPALDGGRIVFVLYEMIFRKPINRKIEGYLHGAVMLMLFAFIIFITLKDIIKLF